MSENSKPERKPAAESSKGRKTVIAVGCGFVVALAILSFSSWVTTPNRDNQYFTYRADGSLNAPVNITDSIKAEVPIVFMVDTGLPEVILELSGEHAKLTGISLQDHAARVIDGRVSSTVIIQFSEKPAITAGTHYLTVLARNPETGAVVREGKIQFNYNMHEVIGKCSC